MPRARVWGLSISAFNVTVKLLEKKYVHAAYEDAGNNSRQEHDAERTNKKGSLRRYNIVIVFRPLAVS